MSFMPQSGRTGVRIFVAELSGLGGSGCNCLFLCNVETAKDVERFLLLLADARRLSNETTGNLQEGFSMRTVAKWFGILILAAAITPYLAEWPVSLETGDAGVAFAKGGGGGSGGGGAGGGSGAGGSGAGGGSGGRGGGSGAGSGSGKGGSGGGGGSGSPQGGKSQGVSSAGMGHGHQGRGVGSAVSEAARSAAHMSQQDLQEAGFRNRGEAVSAAVHEAQRQAREGETSDDDGHVGSPGGSATRGAPTGDTGPATTATQP
jgi:hypothetical protein